MNRGYIYRFLNKEGEVIYIGKAKDLQKRLSSHRHLLKECYDAVGRVECMFFENTFPIDFIEKYYIMKHKPKYNTVFKDQDVETYLSELDCVYENDFLVCGERSEVKSNDTKKDSFVSKKTIDGLFLLFVLIFILSLSAYRLGEISETVLISVTCLLIGFYSGQNVNLLITKRGVVTYKKALTTGVKKMPIEEFVDPFASDEFAKEYGTMGQAKEQGYEDNEVIEEVIEEVMEEDGLFEDELTESVIRFFLESEKRVSASLIQRRFKVGYNRAARIVDEMESLELLEDREIGDTSPRLLILENVERLGIFNHNNAILSEVETVIEE